MFPQKLQAKRSVPLVKAKQSSRPSRMSSQRLHAKQNVPFQTPGKQHSLRGSRQPTCSLEAPGRPECSLRGSKQSRVFPQRPQAKQSVPSEAPGEAGCPLRRAQAESSLKDFRPSRKFPQKLQAKRSVPLVQAKQNCRPSRMSPQRLHAKQNVPSQAPSKYECSLRGKSNMFPRGPRPTRVFPQGFQAKQSVPSEAPGQAECSLRGSRPSRVSPWRLHSKQGVP